MRNGPITRERAAEVYGVTAEAGMIRLTILYNLPDGADEVEFLSWRLTKHQRANESMPGVVHTDFARIVDCWPNGSMPAYRFQTTVEWPDRESFTAGFHDEAVQKKLQENLRRLGNYSFFVSDVLNAGPDRNS